jgi:hypothetical protein
MKFRIVGAHRETGDEVKMVVDAADNAAAAQWANDNDIMWTEITPYRAAPVTGSQIAKVQRAQQAAALAQMTSAETEPSYQTTYSTSAVNIPHTGVTYMHQTVVKAQKGTSGLGIASLVLGIIAAIVCWIPFLGLLSLPVAAIGLFLGLLGFLVSLIGGRSGAGMPLAGLLLCGTAIAITIVTTGGTAKLIGDRMARDWTAKNATNQEELSKINSDTSNPTASTSTAPSATRLSAGDGFVHSSNSQQPEQRSVDKWAPADKGVRQGDVEVRVISAQVAPVPLREEFGGDRETSKEPQLMLTVQIKNTSDSKKIDYRSWAGRDVSFERDYATIHDNFDNNYKRITFGFSSRVVGQTTVESIYPGRSLNDVLVFEPPISKAEYLNLELPAENFSGKGMLRLRVPAKMIKLR